MKRLFDDSDFETMDWHDNKIHAVSFDAKLYRLLLDIDYIVEWKAVGNRYEFKVAPATLIFENVYDLNLSPFGLAMTITGVIKENPGQPVNARFVDNKLQYDWTIILTDGEIGFKSIGFQQYLRKEPVLGNAYLELEERGGISFSFPA